MSLITETLKKMKKENSPENNRDDEVLAPPALRNAIVNTKKYKEFVKNAELRDINGNKAPLKGFVLFSILLIAIIGISAVVFLNKEDNSMIQQAGIVSQEGNSNAQVNNNKAAATPIPSHGRPVGSSQEANNNINQANIQNQNNTAASIDTANQNNTRVDSIVQAQPMPQVLPEEKSNTASLSPNINHQAQQLFQEPVAKAAPAPAPVKVDNKKEEKAAEKTPANIILPNQLFAIPIVTQETKANEESVQINTNTQENNAVNNDNKSVPVSINQQGSQLQMSAAVNESQKPVTNSVAAKPVNNTVLNQAASVNSSREAVNTTKPNNLQDNNAKNAAVIPPSATQNNSIAKLQAAATQPPAAQQASVQNDSKKNTVNNKSTISRKDDLVTANDIKEVKTIKNSGDAGSISASTISLYNQYISTGNKAKKEGSYDRAIEYYVNALALNKTDELSANIAFMYIKLKNPNMAFQVSVTNGIKDTKLLSQLAIIMVQQKYYLEANKLLQYANTFQRSTDVIIATGYLNQSQNKLNDAISYYEEALAIDGTNVNAAYYAGMCYELLGKNIEAKKMYEKVSVSDKASQQLKNQALKKISELMNTIESKNLLTMISFNIESRYAQSLLYKIYLNSTKSSIRKEAVEMINELLEKINIGYTEFRLRCMPNLGFNSKGEKELNKDYKLIVNNDYTLSLFDIKNNKELKKVPQNLDKKLKDKIKELGKEADKFINHSSHILSIMLIDGDILSYDLFKEVFIDNYLMNKFGSGLIWNLYDKDKKIITTFRYSNDGSYLNCDDEEVKINADNFISLATPVEMDNNTIDKWRKQLEDYELSQPINQLTLIKLDKDNLKKEIKKIKNIDTSYGAFKFFAKKYEMHTNDALGDNVTYIFTSNDGDIFTMSAKVDEDIEYDEPVDITIDFKKAENKKEISSRFVYTFLVFIILDFRLTDSF